MEQNTDTSNNNLNTIEFPEVPNNMSNINETIPLLPIPQFYRNTFANSLNPTEMAIRASLEINNVTAIFYQKRVKKS